MHDRGAVVPRPVNRRPSYRNSPPDHITRALPLVWAGMLLGVSFIATPAKFLAPSLSRSAALDVGHQTFRVFGLIEIILALALELGRRGPRPRLLAHTPAAIVLTQGAWLRPRLAQRTRQVIAGKPPSSGSRLHTLYVAGEVAKLAALLAAGFMAKPRSPDGDTGHG